MSAATVDEVLTGAREPHELPAVLHDLYRFAFFDGTQAEQPRIARLNAECDRLYYELHNPAEVRAEHERALKQFDVVQARKTVAEKWAALDRVAAERAEAARG